MLPFLNNTELKGSVRGKKLNGLLPDVEFNSISAYTPFNFSQTLPLSLLNSFHKIIEILNNLASMHNI